jgi:hypothetical protein
MVRKHAFADLRPYVCIVEDCDANHMEFASRNEFAAHLREHQHTKLWACKYCGYTNGKRHLIEAHLKSTHAALNNESRDCAITEKTLLRDLSKQKCPFCDKIPGAVKFVGHLCHHLEEISLSAVPRDAEIDDEDDGNSVQRFSMIRGREPIQKGNSQNELSSSSGVSSPSFGPTSGPLSQQQAEQAKAARKPVIHLLAVQPMMEKDLRDKLPNIRKDELKLGLQGVGDLNDSTGKWELRKNFYKELDVWTFDYDSSADRQLAIDNAVRQYDRMRLGVSEPEWDRLLVKSERGTAKCLSKLQAQIAQSTAARAPKINIQKADGSDTPNGEDDLFGDENLSRVDGESMGWSASQPPGAERKKQALPLLNEHASPLETSTLTNDDAPYDSESDISEVTNPIIDEPSPAPSPNGGSQDGSSRSSSPESHRLAKRKLVLEDEHILANPELYGLRRSVRNCSGWRCKVIMLTFLSRPVQFNTETSYVASPCSRVYPLHSVQTYMT